MTLQFAVLWRGGWGGKKWKKKERHEEQREDPEVYSYCWVVQPQMADGGFKQPQLNLPQRMTLTHLFLMLPGRGWLCLARVKPL